VNKGQAVVRIVRDRETQVSQDSSVGIAVACSFDSRGLISQVIWDFSLFHSVQINSGTHPSDTGCPFPSDKAARA
jgi:hypothetical protein